MNKTWWAVATGSALAGAVLVGLGFYLFEPESFLENLLAEAIGLFVALAVIIVVIEGPILTRQKRVREILEYRRQVFQAAGATAPLIARDIAEPMLMNSSRPQTCTAPKEETGTNSSHYYGKFSGRQWQSARTDCQTTTNWPWMRVTHAQSWRHA